MTTTIPHTTGTAPDPAAVAELLDRSDERDAYLRRIEASWRDGCRYGYGLGYRDGIAAPAEPMDVDEPAPLPRTISPELDRRRYPPHGRQRFADPRPGDYPGRGGDAW